MLATIMLSKKEQKKIEIFQFLETLPAGEHSVKSISDGLGFVYSSTQNLLAEMKLEFDELSEDNITFFTLQGQIHWPIIGITYDQYFSHLIQQGVPYQALLYMLERPRHNLKDFCASHYISIASGMRHLQPLAEYLQQFNLLFNRTKLSLKGDERLIRLTFFNFIWAVSKGDEELFQHFQRGELMATLASLSKEVPMGRDYVGAKEVYLFAEITYLRIKGEFWVEDDPQYDPVLIHSSSLTAQSLQDFFPIKEEHLIAEYRFMQFMHFYAPTYADEQDPRLPMMQEHFQQKNQLTTILRNFEKFWSKEILRGDFNLLEKNPAIHGNLYNILFCYYVFPQRIPTLFNLLSYFRQNQSVLFEALQKQVASFFQRFSRRQGFEWLQNCQQCITDLFTWLTLEYFEESGQRQSLLVALVMESNQLFLQDIKNHLKDLSFIKLVPYSIYEKEHYDFLICSSALLLPEENQTPFFVFNFFSKNTDYVALYRELRYWHRKKNLSYKNQIPVNS